MSQPNKDKPSMQDPAGTLHAGVDLALEKNVGVVVNERVERLDYFNFPQDRGGYDYFLRRLEGLRQTHQAAKVVVESVFGRFKYNRKFRRFNLKVMEKVKTVWGLVYITHNMQKLAAQ
jgi:pyrroloquinoline quinone (PQQ) biosynthesis protein C